MLWNPFEPYGGLTDEQILNAKIILWQGHCSVHQQFRPEHVDLWRKHHPDINIIVHPECCWEVVQKADLAGSTEYIIKVITEAPEGSRWAIGTEINLVHRLIEQNFGRKDIHLLGGPQCLCTTMFRIDLAHLCWSLENLAAGTPVNVIRVDDETARYALEALQRMLEVK